MQLPIRSCLFFPFGQASPVPLCRHSPCFPLRGEWRKAPREVSLNSALFFKPCPCSFFLRKNSQNCQPLRVFPSCLIVLAHNEAKIVSLVPRLPLACIKFCKQNFLRQKCSAASWLPLASSCLRTMRQKLSAASRLPLGGRLLAKQGGEGRSPFLIF